MISNIGCFIYNLSDTSQKKTIRKLEKVSKKLIDAEYATVFNQCCIREKLLPKYSDIKTHDPAAKHEDFTREYRMKLIQFQLEKSIQHRDELRSEVSTIQEEVSSLSINQDLFNNITAKLSEILSQHRFITKNRILKKLNKLYHGQIALPEEHQSFINLSSYEPTESEKKVLNLGINCHIKNNFDPLEKASELELLFCSIQKLETDGVVTVNDNLRDLLRAESTKRRDYKRSNILTKDLQDAAKKLRLNGNIVIRKADKASVFVILDKCDYKRKLDSILSDNKKFKKTTRDTTAELKTTVNRLIATANTQAQSQVFTSITGEFNPGYIYGNVKTHKQNNPLRPIISQIPTPTYKTAKEINKIITPYLQTRYSLSSTDQFLDLLKCTEANGFVASLDVESLFTNVPVEETIGIICKSVYSHSTIPPPAFAQHLLEKLLRACTTEAPFRHIDGTLYHQIDGVAMGSPLGVTFANFYMSHVENKALDNSKNKPSLYCRYVDDCFVVTKSSEETKVLCRLFEDCSALKLTIEENNKRTINFLDVRVDYTSGSYDTAVYSKPTNSGHYINALSECPERYKTGTITALIHRAHKIASNWVNFQSAIEKLRQTLINNGYSNTTFDGLLNQYLNKRKKKEDNTMPITPITHIIYYKNQFSNAHKTDERTIQDIIRSNVKCNNKEEKLQLRIYYKNLKTAQLIIKNNLSRNASDLKQSNVVYQFKCHHADCEPRNSAYIGLTTTSLSRRLTMHLQSGAIKSHFTEKHGTHLTRQDLVQHTSILRKCPDYHRLQIQEALLIKKNQPEINLQSTGLARTLHLHGNH